MQEPQRKGLKDLFKKIVKKVSDTEKTIHGNMGRDALDAADKLGERLPRFLKPDSDDVDPKDMAKAMEIWKNQGLGKIGNQPKADKYMNKPIPDYITKSDDPYTMMKYGEMSKKILKQNLVEMRPSPSKGEIAAGRAITTGAALGTGAAKAHSYWTNKKNEKK